MIRTASPSADTRAFRWMAVVRRSLLSAIIAAGAGCSQDVVVGPASDVPAFGPGPLTQQLAFASNRDGNWEIYRVNADGSGLLRLTANAMSDGPNGLGGYEIVWSPDGNRIAFTTNRSGSVEIAVMSVDGTGFAYLTSTAGNEFDLAWSPDGSQIAFARKRPADTHPDLWTVTTVRTPVETNLTATAGAAEDQPSWSADGRSIAYRSRSPVLIFDDSRIAVLQLSGGLVTTFDGLGIDHTDPNWSRDGMRIAFISNADGDADLYTFLPDGTSMSQLLNHAGDDARPKWSPDGAKLVFENTTTGSAGIWVVNSNGTMPMQIALSGTAGPSWAPNSTRVAYERHDVLVTPTQVRPISDIYTVLPSGSSPILIVAGPSSKNVHPVWRPL